MISQLSMIIKYEILPKKVGYAGEGGVYASKKEYMVVKEF